MRLRSTGVARTGTVQKALDRRPRPDLGMNPNGFPRKRLVILNIAIMARTQLFFRVMRTHLNVSRRPFINHRLFWIAMLSIFFISLWLGLWIAAEKSRVSAQIVEVKNKIKSTSEMAEAARQEEARRQQENQKIVLTEQQVYELAAARQLIEDKSLSWNRVLGDIERYVPKNAHITDIAMGEVYDAGSGATARVEIKAAGQSVAEMTEMMDKLEKSNGLFIIDQATQSQAEGGEVPFTLQLTYVPSRGGAQ